MLFLTGECFLYKQAKSGNPTENSGSTTKGLVNVPATTAGNNIHNSSGSRAGLFRTPISGGVQSATSSHGLPHPAIAVRNLIEQVKLSNKLSRNLIVRHLHCLNDPSFTLNRL